MGAYPLIPPNPLIPKESAMNKPLRILIVEDSEDDAALLLHELRRGGYDPAYERVETPEAMSAALDRQTWDVILSDYRMPQFSAPAALALLQVSGLDLPFIIISGTIGEDTAVAALKAGAHDFLVKGNWARLIPAIERELREAEARRVQREAQSALRRSERRFAAFMHNLPGGAFIKDAQAAYLYANGAVEAALRLKPGAWLGKTDDELWPADVAARLKENDRAVMETGQALQTIETVPQADGLHHWLIGKFPMLDREGNLSLLGGVWIDITEQRRAEEALRESEVRYRRLFEDSPVSLWEEDFSAVKQHLEGLRRQGVIDFRAFLANHPEVVAECAALVKITDVNNATLKLYRADSKADLLKNLDRIFSAESYDFFLDQLVNIADGKTEFESEGSNQTLTGDKIDVILRWSAAPGDGDTWSRIIISLMDVTERKRAEEEIRRHAARAEALAHAAARLNAQLDLETVLNTVCEETARALNVPAVSVGLYEPDHEVFVLAASLGLPSDYLQHHRPIPRAVYEAYVQRQGPLVVLPDASALPDLPNAELYLRHNIRTIAAAQLIRAGQLVGTLNAYTFEESRAFSEDELTLFQGLADQAAQAITNARLYAEAERRLDHVQALRRIDTAITASLDLRVTLNIFLDEVLRQLHVDAAAVLLFNAPTQTLAYAAGRGFRTSGIERARPRLGEGYPGRAALERRTVAVPNLTKTTGDLSRALLLAEETFQAYYGAPLIAKGQVQGVLEVFHRAPLDPDEEWLEFLEALAGQAAIAIDNITLFDDLQRSNTQLVVAYDATIEGWSRALDLRDKETEGHTQRVTETTLRLAQAMGVSEQTLVHVRRGALLHDIGKMGVPDGILLKPGPLTEEEWVLMRKHPGYAYEMLSPISFLSPALDIPYCHHEKWDGTGYPRGLKAEQIPLAARLFAVVDVWDALRSDRPYRLGWPEAKVREHIRSLAGAHFDPQAVDIFLRLER